MSHLHKSLTIFPCLPRNKIRPVDSRQDTNSLFTQKYVSFILTNSLTTQHVWFAVSFYSDEERNIFAQNFANLQIANSLIDSTPKMSIPSDAGARLLDFSTRFDIDLLDRVVSVVYKETGEQVSQLI